MNKKDWLIAKVWFGSIKPNKLTPFEAFVAGINYYESIMNPKEKFVEGKHKQISLLDQINEEEK